MSSYLVRRRFARASLPVHLYPPRAAAGGIYGVACRELRTYGEGRPGRRRTQRSSGFEASRSSRERERERLQLHCSGLELKILRFVGEGGIKNGALLCARGEAGDRDFPERETHTAMEAEQSSREVVGSRVVGHADRESKGKKLGLLVEDMTKIFCLHGTRFLWHGTIIKLPRQGARKNATPVRVRAHLATTHSHTSK